MAQTAVTLRQATVRSQTLATSVLSVIAGAALVAAVSQVRIPLPFTPVPITGQTFGVLLVGAALGARHGGASMLLYLVVGALGLPVYAGASGGWDVVAGPTGGYLLGFLAAGWVVGRLAERGWDRRLPTAAAAMLVGNLVIYAFGLVWLGRQLEVGVGRTLELGLYPFLLGDLIKLLLAVTALKGAWRLLDQR